MCQPVSASAAEGHACFSKEFVSCGRQIQSPPRAFPPETHAGVRGRGSRGGAHRDSRSRPPPALMEMESEGDRGTLGVGKEVAQRALFPSWSMGGRESPTLWTRVARASRSGFLGSPQTADEGLRGSAGKMLSISERLPRVISLEVAGGTNSSAVSSTEEEGERSRPERFPLSREPGRSGSRLRLSGFA
jgi:hypothetical protein